MERIARKTGFMQRRGKLSAKSFLHSVLFHCFNGRQMSLNDHLLDLDMHQGISLRKQSLFERFNHKAVAFLKYLVEEQLSVKWSGALQWKWLEPFEEVLIEDSVRFQLPDHLKGTYPGNGGDASAAGAHLQFAFDLKSGHIKTMSVNHAQYQDQKVARDQISRITKNTLIIRDLGYFAIDVLEAIQQKEAFFISRLKPKMTIYEQHKGQWIKIQVDQLYKQLKQSKQPYLEKPVYIGPNKFPVRLLIELMPDHIVEDRLRKAKKQAVKKGRHLTDLYKSFARLNLFITNIPSADLPANQIHQLYRLRWQVELVFKTWKSYFQVHQFKKMSLHRTECYLYASLLFIVTGWELYYRLANILWREKQKLISKMKFAKAWIQYKTKWRAVLCSPRFKIHQLVNELYDFSRIYLVQDSRKNSHNLEDYLPVYD